MRSCFILVSMLCLLALPARANEIRAVVNSDIITDYDVESRVRLALVSSGIPDTAQTRKTLTAQVLRSLIDETLQLQEAARLKIKITDQEVARGLALLEQQNKMQPGQLKKLLARENVPVSTLEQQVRVSIGWGKLVQGRFARRAVVSDSEIRATQERLGANMGKPEYRVGEILIPTGGPSPTSAQAAARRLFDQIMQGQGASFATLARQFSASPTASVGGDMGWILADDLDPPFSQLVTQMQPGQISAPVEIQDGYRIIVLAERRLIGVKNTTDATVTLHQLVFPVGSKARSAAVRDRAARLAAGIQGCRDAEAVAQAETLPLSGSLGQLRLADLPPSVQQAVLQTSVNRATPPLQVGEAWAVMTVCDKTMPSSALPDADRIRDQLRLRKVERLAQQYLRDLRQGAYINVRNDG